MQARMMKPRLLLAIGLVLGLLRAVQSVTNYTSGEYTISYDDRQLPMLRIYTEPLGKLVWFSSTKDHTPLVVAAQATRKVTQIGGNFIIDDKIEEACTDMNITKTGSLPPSDAKLGYESVFFEGTLCGGVTSFQLTFQDTIVTEPPSEGGQVYHHLRFNATLNDPTGKYNQLRVAYGCAEDEQLYGFGAQYSKFNVKGSRLPVFLSEQGVGRGLQPFTFALNQVSPGAGG